MKPIPAIPRLKNIARQLDMGKEPIRSLMHNRRAFGEMYSMYLGPLQVVVSTLAESAQHALKKNHKNYKRSPIVDMLKDQIGNGLLTADGAYWLQQRRLIQPAFHKKRLAELSLIMQQETQTHLSILDKKAESGEQFNFVDEMMHLTFKVVSKALFSTGLSNEMVDEVGNAVDQIQQYMVMKIRTPFLVPYHTLTGRVDEMNRARKVMDDIIYRIIAERRTEEPKGDLLSMLIDSRYEDTGEGMSDEQIHDESIVMMSAGYETSSNALSWTFYVLDQHPEVLARILEEVKAVVPEDQAVGFEHLPKLEYTMRVIKESMRLYPPVWIIDRTSIDKDEMNGYEVPPESNVNFFIYGIHRSERYWDNPHKFDPDRFLKENFTDKNKIAYFPFGGGPRMCIGYMFALYEIQMIVAELVRRYKFTYKGEGHPGLEAQITMRPKNLLPMTVARRH